MARRNLPNGEAVPMEPGERNRRVLIQQVTKTIGPSGFPVETWTTLGSVWMRKMDASMNERFRSSQVSAAVDTQWEMGYRQDMDPDEVEVQKTRRLLYRSRIYDIKGASTIGRREGIELLTLSKAG